MAEAQCLFCRIMEGKVPSQIVRQDDDTVAIRDINPQAPTHVLVMPRRHIPSLDALEGNATPVATSLWLAARAVARQEGIDRTGYRLVLNNGPDALQSVDHIHLHVLGGRRMGWPPG